MKQITLETIFKSQLTQSYTINIGCFNNPFWMAYEKIGSNMEIIKIGKTLPGNFSNNSIGEFSPVVNERVPIETKMVLKSFPKLNQISGVYQIHYNDDLIFLIYGDLHVDDKTQELRGDSCSIIVDSDTNQINYIPLCFQSSIEKSFQYNFVGVDLIKRLKNSDEFSEVCNKLGLPYIPKGLEENLGFSLNNF